MHKKWKSATLFQLILTSIILQNGISCSSSFKFTPRNVILNTFQGLNVHLGGPGKIVETSSGQVQGVSSMSRDGRPVYEWLGIPYATVEKRFASPMPVKPWTGVRNTVRYGPVCPQLDLVTHRLMGQEDCLSLNVYIPQEIPEGKLVPVFIFVHGGYYTSGSSKQYRPDYFMDFDVAFVIFNYRLGPLGFLNTGDENSRGNMGLKDQSMAIKWVQQNINKFGPVDPNQIILMGQSAGSSSVHLHMLSPMSKGLLSKVIAQSGVSLSPWAMEDDPVAQAQRLASTMNCPIDQGNLVMVECLRKIPVAQLIKEANLKYLTVSPEKGAIFKPTVEFIDDEEAFIAVDPLTLFKAGNFSHIPFMTGTTKHEGFLFSREYLRNAPYRAYLQNSWYNFTKISLLLKPRELEFAQEIRDLYFGKDTQIDKFNVSTFFALTNLLTEITYTRKVMLVANFHSKNAPVYLYQYERPGPSLFPLLEVVSTRSIVPLVSYEVNRWLSRISGNRLNTKRLEDEMIMHGDDITMLFHMPLIVNIRPGDPNYKFSKDLVKLWVDFAYDDANMNFRGVKFPRIEKGDQNKFKHLAIRENPSFNEFSEDLQNRLAFWDSIENQI